MKITHTLIMTPDKLCINGKIIETKPEATELLPYLYRKYVADYPKYFKMDTLAKVGFVASEILLTTEKNGAIEQRMAYNTAQRALILFNRTSSLNADTNYQKTINDSENYYPSPSTFVYTLPNIVTGEIAIRNRYYGEINFIVLTHLDTSMMTTIVETAFNDTDTQSILSGWIDCTNEHHYDVRLFIAEKDNDDNQYTKNKIEELLKI